MKLLNKHLSIALAFIVLPSLIYAQKSNSEINQQKGKNELDFSFTPQYYFNKMNIHNDAMAGGKISTKNTAGFNLSLDYYRVTHYGMVYGAGFSFGQIGHNISINYNNFNFFYPKNDYPTLNQYLATNSAHYHVNKQINFLSLHPSIGYRFKLPGARFKNWNFQVDFMYEFRFYLNGGFYHDGRIMQYTSKTGDTIFVNIPLLNVYYEFGKDDNLSFWRQQVHSMYVANITISKEINWRCVSNVNIGVKVTYAAEGRNSPDGSYYHSQTSGSGFATSDSYDYTSAYQFPYTPISHSEYRARDFSIGIKLGVGLWPVKKAK